MNRFLVPDLSDQGEFIDLPVEESRHAASVLRVREGERVELLNGRGARADAEVISVSRRLVGVRIDSFRVESLPETRVELFPALLKNRAMDWLLPKAVELGAHRIVPLTTERSVVALDEARAETRLERWRSQCAEALKQCGRAWLPVVEGPWDWARAERDWAGADLLLGGVLGEGERPSVSRCMEDWRTACGKRPGRVVLVIGPEGDFTRKELNWLGDLGVCGVDLGPTVLRSETAALALLTLVCAELRQAAGGEGML